MMYVPNFRKKTAKEKRKFVRVREYRLVKYREPDNSQKLSFVRDYSEGGILFHCKEDLSPGRILEMELNFPELENPVKVKTQVLRTKKLNRVEGFEVAAVFLEIGEELIRVLKRKNRGSSGKSQIG